MDKIFLKMLKSLDIVRLTWLTDLCSVTWGTGTLTEAMQILFVMYGCVPQGLLLGGGRVLLWEDGVRGSLLESSGPNGSCVHVLITVGHIYSGC